MDIVRNLGLSLNLKDLCEYGLFLVRISPQMEIICLRYYWYIYGAFGENVYLTIINQGIIIFGSSITGVSVLSKYFVVSLALFIRQGGRSRKKIRKL